ncbi:hypothetical protein MPL3365_260071 [Mesorhizobium plurifarium]|uniref:Uncharacterized protein n=1 Tax=Mesorhizobium plurifarium TaxID=69974 RepID=A0A090G5K7_MESPL|nr:hypothetical protein MPL3365_260071 [Mesorhizobium plurifarium]
MKLSFHIGKGGTEAPCAAREELAEPDKADPASHKRHQTPLASAMAMHYQKTVSVFY